jgi:hypothetical protein
VASVTHSGNSLSPKIHFRLSAVCVTPDRKKKRGTSCIRIKQDFEPLHGDLRRHFKQQPLANTGCWVKAIAINQICAIQLIGTKEAVGLLYGGVLVVWAQVK